MSWTTGQKYLAEFLGTFALLLFGGGAAVTSLTVGFIDPLARVFLVPFPVGFIDPLARVVLVSFAFGIAALGAAYALGEISGGHFNPAVTLSMAFNRRMPWQDAIPYIVAQLVGGILGISVVAGIVHGNSAAWNIGVQASFGSQCYAGGSAP